MDVSPPRPFPRAALSWREDAVPVSVRFDDPYYSLAGGLAETGHVFLAGNGLPGRFRDGFHVAELGFGTGLNFLATLAAFRARGTGGRLRYTAFEAWPMAAADIARALAPFGGLPVDALLGDGEAPDALIPVTCGPDHDLHLVFGDATQTVPVWAGQADAWFLDGFSPAKNPDMWTEALMLAVARATAPGGTFATYTAAGHVRRALAAAGFAVTRRPGFGTKRHMTTGVLGGGAAPGAAAGRHKPGVGDAACGGEAVGAAPGTDGAPGERTRAPGRVVAPTGPIASPRRSCTPDEPEPPHGRR